MEKNRAGGKNEWQAWKNQGTRCENEEIAGRNLLKHRMNAGKGLKKSHAMKARQSFEKARNIEASLRQAYSKNQGSEAQRRAASVGVRSQTVCKGMRSDAEEDAAKSCEWRKIEEHVEKP